ncbi:MCE family protein [Aeromicrobium sp.]|uniref:MCE family protein n=1 Tax=Aeromicrobium sp. TaxID=1871063 RepID=UPI003C476A1F
MSSAGILQRLTAFSKPAVAFVILMLLAASLLVFGGGNDKRYVTVEFDQVNSVYQNSDVKVLGVPIGKIESLTPRGNVVRVKLSYDPKYKLPADVKAVVVSPSIVGDRFIQLAPAYSGGPTLKDGGFIPVDRTAVPVELDQIYQSLDDLSVALGPKGANKEGSLSNLIDNTARQFDGQGAQLNETISNFAKLSTTLSNNKDELFGSLREVGEFVQLLKTNDSSVRAFNTSTAQVSTVLAGERIDLEKTLKALSLALVDVNSLVKENRGVLRTNVKNLQSVTKVFANRQSELAEASINAPTALSNVSMAYYAKFGTLNTRANIGELVGGLKDPSTFLCALLGESSAQGDTCNTLKGLAAQFPPPPALPRAAASSERPPRLEQVHASLSEMLAVK